MSIWYEGQEWRSQETDRTRSKRPLRNWVKIVLASPVVSLCLAFIFQALSIYGITSTRVARGFLILAWISAIIGMLVSDYLFHKPLRHIVAVTVSIAVLLGGFLVGIDRYAMNKKAQLDASLAPPTPLNRPLPSPPVTQFPRREEPIRRPVTNQHQSQRNLGGTNIQQLGNGNTAIGTINNSFGGSGGNLRDRAIGLSEEISRGMQEKFDQEFRDNPQNLARNLDSWFRWKYLARVSQIHDEFADMHIRNQKLDEFFRGEKSDEKMREMMRQFGRNDILPSRPVDLDDANEIARALREMAQQLK